MRVLIFILLFVSAAITQVPPIEPGVSHELAKWRAAHYSDVRYKLQLTLEKMAPVLNGTIEIRVNVSVPPAVAGGSTPIILDWRKIKGHEEKSTISNVSINGRVLSPGSTRSPEGGTPYGFEELNEHLIFRDGVVAGENVIKLDFTSPILPSGSAITRYIDKEDGSEYIYTLFVPSDASTAFPVFDQPDLKARFKLFISKPDMWPAVSNGEFIRRDLQEGTITLFKGTDRAEKSSLQIRCIAPECLAKERSVTEFEETRPISPYVFAFAAGDFVAVGESEVSKQLTKFRTPRTKVRVRRAREIDPKASASVISVDQYHEGAQIYVRKSQLAKFQPHAAEIFRLNREGVKFLEEYFNYKFPFPKYDLVLIPEFPFGGMEHAGATFLREASVIFPQEPTKNDHISRANLIFHEAAHQWFGDTVTMRWFDDLWLKEGFAEFMAYKTLEKVMPEYNAWKVFYERNKQAAYLTDSTKGTTPIYQPIANLNAAKSAYGNIVYRKAPSFLKQAEFYIGPDKFQTAVRSFLKKHEFANAGWPNLVQEFESASNTGLQKWANDWITQRGLPIFRARQSIIGRKLQIVVRPEDGLNEGRVWSLKTNALVRDPDNPEAARPSVIAFKASEKIMYAWFKEFEQTHGDPNFQFVFPNYNDYGYGIFLLDAQSREYVLKNIQNEKDDFLRSMMWGALWDSVREGELDPKEYVELVLLRVLSPDFRRPVVAVQGGGGSEGPPKGVTQYAQQRGTPDALEDETTVATLLNRVSTAMTYYVSDKQRDEIGPRLEQMLIDRMRDAPTLGQRVTYYRAFLNVASTANARSVLKQLLHESVPSASAGGSTVAGKNPSAHADGTDKINRLPLKTKDRFDIVTRLLILNDPEAPKLLADLEKSETSDEAKRYAYAAKAGIATAENKAKFWNDFTTNKEISESWIEAAFGPFNSVRHADLTLPYLERALKELPNHKRNRKIFFVNGWLGAFIGGQRSEEALAIVNKFLADNPNLDRDLRLKILENVDVIERAVKIRGKFATR